MKDLNFELKKLCDRNRDGSHATQHDRHRVLQLIADDLCAIGFRRMVAKSLKPKHIEALVSHYQDKELNTGTIKNRMSAIRWWAEKIGKPNVVAKDNAYYGIESRAFVTEGSKAKELDKTLLANVRDAHVRMSLELQKAFGLRREEAIKFIPDYADQGNHIRLKATWCKGGRAREIPIRNEDQREVLNRAHELAGKGSLIPAHLMYIQQLRRYEQETTANGLNNMHGLRHRYAQERYKELTGWDSPACGGPIRKTMIEEERLKDTVARYAITQELGHGRPQITTVYLGS